MTVKWKRHKGKRDWICFYWSTRSTGSWTKEVLCNAKFVHLLASVYKWFCDFWMSRFHLVQADSLPELLSMKGCFFLFIVNNFLLLCVTFSVKNSSNMNVVSCGSVQRWSRLAGNQWSPVWNHQTHQSRTCWRWWGTCTLASRWVPLR